MRVDPYFTIVKVQKSIYGKPSTLIYNKEKTLFTMEEPHFASKYLKDRLKVYLKVKVTLGNKIKILKRVNDKDW